MEKGKFYFIKDSFYKLFKEEKLMKNKEIIDLKEHNRPCFYTYYDENTKIYWLIPISSKTEKYRKIYNYKMQKNKICDTIVFGNVLGYEKVFLIQNMFPIIQEFIQKEYKNKDNKSVAVTSILQKRIDEKAQKVLKLQRIGINLIFPDVLKMEEKLLEILKESKMNKVELEKIKEKALAEHIPIIMDDTLEVIEKLLEDKKIHRILEIGTAVGYSAICFSEFLEDGGNIDTIEREEERVIKARENIKKAEVEDKINIYFGDAVEILPTFKDKYDMIFIDAAKGKYPFFLSQALRLLASDGIILADNVLYKGYVMSDYNKHKQRTAVRNLREYIKEVTENPSLETKILEVGDGLAVSIRKEDEAI